LAGECPAIVATVTAVIRRHRGANIPENDRKFAGRCLSTCPAIARTLSGAVTGKAERRTAALPPMIRPASRQMAIGNSPAFWPDICRIIGGFRNLV